MRRGKRLIILLAVFAVVAGAAAAAVWLLPGEDLQEYEEIQLLSFDTDEARSLSYTYGGESVELVNSNGTWEYAPDSDFPLDEGYVSSMLAALSSLTATQEITAPEDTAQYGLDEPALTVSVTTDTETTLTIGDETGMGGERYVSTGDGNVYLVDSAIVDPFSYGLYDLIEYESIPNMGDTVSFTVESSTQNYTLQHITEDAPAYSDYYEWFLDAVGGLLALSTTSARGVVSGVTGVSWLECACYNADADALAEYGLDEPSATATVLYNYTEEDEDGEEQEFEAEFTLELGSYCSDGVYARIAGSEMVYVVAASTLDNLLDLTPETDMLPTEPVRLTLGDVTGFDVTVGGDTYSVEITRETVYDDDGNESEETHYTLADGTELDSGAVGAALSSLNGMSGNGSASDRDGAELAGFTFYQDREGFETVTLSFKSYNSSSCLTTLNGETRVLAPLDTVQSVIDSLLSAFSGETEAETE